jgi:hypothetical protein
MKPASGPAFLLIVLFLLTGSLLSCKGALLLKSQAERGDPAGVYDPDYEGRDSRTFYAWNTKNRKTYSVNAVHLAENDYCVIYGEPSAGISLAAAENIAAEFKNGVYPVITEMFGDFREYMSGRDFGRYDKLTLFLLDIKDDYDPQTNLSYIAGYFNPQNMYRSSQYASSNEAALLYVDVNPGTINEDFFSAIAHEFQHLINYSIRMQQQGGGNIYVKSQDVWIDEGLSAAAEYLYHGRHIQKRVDYFNTDVHGRISRGDTFFIWDGWFEDYCTVYLFFQWLRIQAGEQAEIYKDIIHSNYLDYRAVTRAAAEHLGGQFGDWETLLGHWLLANCVNAEDGYLGYKQEIKTEIRDFYSTRTSLAPGEGVFSFLDGGGFTPNTQSGAHIRYLGVTQAGERIDAPEGVFPAGKTGRLLTFNANSQNSAQAEDGYLTGRRDPFRPQVRDGGAAREAVPAQEGPLPIDIPPAFFLE